ncbi:MAG: glycosyltransferase family 2 protein [Bacteroidales bacterium]|nr:glycosyltransferase family 2 protein [Bacteroidales bacterium]
MKKLGVIILNWNGLKLLKELLPGVSAATVSDEADLIVADNGSDDGSVAWVREHHPEVKIIAFDRNHGFAEGYNLAIEAAREYRYITLLNSDVETPAGWWQPILRFMESHPEVGAVQPKIRSYYRREEFEYAGAAGGALDNLGYPYCRGRLFDAVERDEGQYDGEPVDVAWASGACLTVPRELYLQVGGLDPKFFAHMEEIDLCCRIAAAGYRISALTDSHVFHIGGASLEQGNPRKTYLNFRNNLLLIHKNMTRRGGSRMLLKRRLADTLAFGMYLIKRDLANARAILKAHNDFRRMRREYTDFPDRDILPTLPGHKHSAVAARYIKRKKSLPL